MVAEPQFQCPEPDCETNQFALPTEELRPVHYARRTSADGGECVYDIRSLTMGCGERWPRVRWIPTGPLVGCPKHAAGYHLEKQGRTTLDRMGSSYAISLRSVTGIVHSRQQPRPETVAGSRAASVAMTDTPEQSTLHFASHEIRAVQTESMGYGQSSQLHARKKSHPLYRRPIFCILLATVG